MFVRLIFEPHVCNTTEAVSEVVTLRSRVQGTPARAARLRMRRAAFPRGAEAFGAAPVCCTCRRERKRGAGRERDGEGESKKVRKKNEGGGGREKMERVRGRER